MAEQCPLCLSELKSLKSDSDSFKCECDNCGRYALTRAAYTTLGSKIERTENGRAKLKHAVLQISKSKPGSLLDDRRIDDLLAHMVLPKPAELLDNLILWLGNSQDSLGSDCEVPRNIDAVIGATEPDDVAFLVDQCKKLGLLEGSVERFGGGNFEIMPLNLTMAGWTRFEELKRGATMSRLAFMAMQFGDPELDRIYTEHLRPAVAATGFDLRRVDEAQPAGLIDDHLRVKIRQSRFLLADLTHQNRGAYWEAGFAEGLGKPVIYLCRRDVFEDKSAGTHFDTNHHLTVIWDPKKMDEFVGRLKDTIRATLPAEAVY